MNLNDLLNLFSIIGMSFSLSGCIMVATSLLSKISNYTNKKFVLIPPKAFLMLFFGSIITSLPHIYKYEWSSFSIQILTSIFNLYIYRIHKKSYEQRLKDEIL